MTITPSTSHTTTASACGSYTWSVNGQTYTTSGTRTVVTGCNTEILVLTITPNTSHTTTISACDSYTWSGGDGQTYAASGNYVYVKDCNTETLALTITPSTSHSTTASACGSYTWSVNSQTYTTSGTYTSVSGCHTETLVLTITPNTSHSTTASACGSYTWSVNGQTYNASGTYTSVTSCNTETLVLTITPSTSHTTTASACESYTWSENGQTYNASGTYTSVTGCHTEVLNLTINTPSVTVDTITRCESYTWIDGNTYTESGDYSADLGTNPLTGCNDSAILHLTINKGTTTEVSASACGSYVWSLSNATYTASGDYSYDTTDATTGCTNHNILHLTITNEITVQPSSTTLICATTGSTATISVGIPLGVSATYQWQSRTSATAALANVVNGANYAGATTPTLVITRTTVPAAGTVYVLKVTTSCGVRSSNPSTLSLSPTPVAKAITGASPVCYGTNSKTLTLGASTVGTIQWQSAATNSINNADWTNIGSPIAPTAATNAANTYTATDLTASTWFRVQLTTASCSAVNTTAVQIVVNPTSVAGSLSIGGSTEVALCSGSSSSLALVDYVGAIKWYKSTNYGTSTSPTWSLVTGTLPTLATGALTATTWYKADVTSGVCSLSTSNIVKATVSPKVVVKAITGASPVCYGTNSKTLTLAASSVGTIQWQSAATNSTNDADWTNVGAPIAPTTTANAANSYTATNLTASTWYRVKLTSGPCASATTTAVQIVVNPTSVAGTASPETTTVCSGSGASLTLSGYTGTIKWYKSTNYNTATPTWTATTIVTPTLATGALTATTWYRADVTSGVCSVSSSNVVVVNITPKPVAKPISSPTTAGSTVALALCTSINVAKTLNVATGSIGTITWQVSTTSTTAGFIDIPGATGASYTISSFTDSGTSITYPIAGVNYYRAKFSNGSCTDAFSTAMTLNYKVCPGASAPAKIIVEEVAAVKTPFAVVAYPNPYTESFNLSLTTSSEDKVGVMVYDMTGRLIDQREFNMSQVSEQQLGDRYPTGVYNVIVTQGTEVKTLRMIKR